MTLADTRFETRRRKVAAAFANERLDSLLVTHLTHVRYLSGFSGSNGGLIIHKDLSAKVATDGRYTTQISQEVPDLECLNARNCGADLLAEVSGPRRVGIEADFVSLSEMKALEKAAKDGVTLVPIRGLIEKVRLIKDDLELERLTEVAELASAAMQEVLNAGQLAVGRTERQVAADLEYNMRKLGSEKVSFDTIVASGPNSAMPHHGADDRVIERGDIVTIDFGAHLLGYNSDCTRTYIMGEASDFANEIYDIVFRSQAAGLKAALAGVSAGDVDKASRDVIEEAGYGEYFVHSTGHGVGLDVHEAPSAARGNTQILKPSMTVTVEPGVYVPGKGGVRIEDTVIITDGAPKLITTLPKELTIIGD